MNQSYEDAQAILTDQNGNPTPHYQAYLKYRNEYDAKVKALQEAYANALTDPIKFQNWPIEGMSYQNEVDRAMDQWLSLGFKHEIETAIAILEA